MVDSEAPLVHQQGKPSPALAGDEEKYERVIASVREMHRGGVPFLTGTDFTIPGALPGSSKFEEFKDLSRYGRIARRHGPLRSPIFKG